MKGDEHKDAGHRQRLRDKFQERGIDAFTDAEVVELLLTLGTPRRDCKEAARAALARFGTLPAVLEAEPAALSQVKGLGPNNTFAIRFLHGVARRYLEQRLRDKHYLHSSREVADYLTHAMRDLSREVFMVLYLDAQHGIIDSEIVARGTITSNTIYPRELVKEALHRHAAALVVAHNHPSGIPQPSDADRRLTRNLYLACALMNINLLDHLIIAGSAPPYSFADHGLMAAIREECATLL
ncbi:MAG: DNA repair protein RadC [Desulfobulbaceae bacterium]|nr:DNA repair protein RadC [Desulfobulbaceae bacterium]